MKRVLVVLVAIGVLATARPADALSIQYRAIDLQNDPAGQDLWQYEYLVSGHDFLSLQGFAIDFDPALYLSLQDPPPTGNTGWDIVTYQPQPALPLPGAYDALAISDAPTLLDAFTVSFIWLGAPGTGPGSQAFTLYELDAGGMFIDTLESGVTTPADTAAVPEPATLVLLLSGLVAAARRPWRRVND